MCVAAGKGSQPRSRFGEPGQQRQPRGSNSVPRLAMKPAHWSRFRSRAIKAASGKLESGAAGVVFQVFLAQEQEG